MNQKYLKVPLYFPHLRILPVIFFLYYKYINKIKNLIRNDEVLNIGDLVLKYLNLIFHRSF